jgi:hypothetical protein
MARIAHLQGVSCGGGLATVGAISSLNASLITEVRSQRADVPMHPTVLRLLQRSGLTQVPPTGQKYAIGYVDRQIAALTTDERVMVKTSLAAANLL